MEATGCPTGLGLDAGLAGNRLCGRLGAVKDMVPLRVTSVCITQLLRGCRLGGLFLCGLLLRRRLRQRRRACGGQCADDENPNAGRYHDSTPNKPENWAMKSLGFGRFVALIPREIVVPDENRNAMGTALAVGAPRWVLARQAR